MYAEIHQLKDIGLKKSQVARRLEINVKTVDKYWEVNADDFARLTEQSKQRSRKLDRYHDTILGWLKNFPELSAAQVNDWLKEHYPGIHFRERTVRRYVACLREKHHLDLKTVPRQYQAVADPPMGKQMQLDFGQTTVRKSTGGYLKIYAMGAVLSHSRYRYAQWSDRPLTTSAFIQMLLGCFDYLGGMPEELVFDQDRLLAVSENCGDIIYTCEFERFKQTMGFQVWLCRAGDPESKGRIEAFVKYLKRNFAANRLFTDLNTWNQCCEDWLERTANSKIHGTTKKVPAAVFLQERQYLRPVPCTRIVPTDILTRVVRKDNTILYKGNRYSVPIGTYKPGLELLAEEEAGILTLRDPLTDLIIARHKLSLEKGALIQNTHHLRDNTKKIEELFTQTLKLLGGNPGAATFLETIRREKRRYVREQFGLMQKLAQQYPPDLVTRAIDYCLTYRLFSAVDCRSVAEYLLVEQPVAVAPSKAGSLPEHLRIKAAHRDIAVYAGLTGGEKA